MTSWQPRRPQSSGSQLRRKGSGEERRNWFDMEPSDWVERRRRCPRPQSAPANREDYRRETYPQRVRELLVSRRAERGRVRWINRLTDAHMLKPERQDKFVRCKIEAERNIAKMEEELNKIAVRKGKPKHSNPDSNMLDVLERASGAGSPNLTPTQRAFAMRGSDQEQAIKSSEVGLDRETWLWARLHPEGNLEKDPNRGVFNNKSLAPTSSTQSLRVHPGKRDTNPDDFTVDSMNLDDLNGVTSQSMSMQLKGERAPQRLRRPRTETAPADASSDFTDKSSTLGRREPKGDKSKLLHRISHVKALSGANTSSAKMRTMTEFSNSNTQ
eukprot:gnl/MRDRNA2_/MRDRNA2_71494_c0_seq2.p1 gnl/MRDRNA2_/MRDRNA2_71494_c0~~gnl/MRDRNA2_/MRDRNA2_71494_c0_seq2.p1  ORF type:complete len:328 (+),score=50.80 gnl/MRDRNA2_/MRDRNA2_71494_c0_seq2:101-1084(+)